MNVRPLVLLLFITISGCKKEAPVKQVAAPPVPTPIGDRDTERHHLAPEGVFFLMERVSVASQYGVTGIAPGTRVRLVEDRGTTFRVSDGNTTFDVSTEKLTDDIDLGALVARSDAQSQQLLADYVQRQNAADRQMRDDYNAMLDQQARDVEQSRAAAAAAAPHSSGKLDRGAYNKDPWPPWIYRRHSFESYHPRRY
jgi:hypothetical protein